MRIDEIDLIRFGHFASRKIDFPQRTPDYYLIYGDNEAGKSTLLRGISALLFGVPSRTPDTHSCKPAELRIGGTLSDGKEKLSFRRRKGTVGTLLNIQETQIQDSALAPFVRELDRDRFEQFFGLNHKRLREGGDELLRGKGDVGSALFQASGLLELRNLLEQLDAEARELFTPKSRTKAIPRAIDEYRQARSEIRRLAVSATEVKQKQAELEAARSAVESLKTELQSLQQQLVRLHRIASNKPDLARLQDLRSVLRDLDAVPDLPLSARGDREEAIADQARSASQIHALSEQREQRKKRIDLLPVSSAVTTHAKEIEGLNAGINDYVHSVHDRPKRIEDKGAGRRSSSRRRGMERDLAQTSDQRRRSTEGHLFPKVRDSRADYGACTPDNSASRS